MFQSEELENKRVLNLLFRGQRLDWVGGLTLGEKRRLVSRQLGALEELGGDLPVELTDRPSAPQSFCFVEIASLPVVDGEEPDVMRPREGKRALPSQVCGSCESPVWPGRTLAWRASSV